MNDDTQPTTKQEKPDNRSKSRQELFVQEYLVDLNGTEAAKRAGYAPTGAAVQASRLLKKDKIRARIDELMRERSERTKIKADYVVESLREVVERCLQRTPVMKWDHTERRLKQATDEEGRSVWQFDSIGANRALELLGKHLDMFGSKSSAQPSVTVQVRGVAQAIIAAAGGALPESTGGTLVDITDSGAVTPCLPDAHSA